VGSLIFDKTIEDMMNILETEHLLFRPLTLSDLDELIAMYADPDVMQFLGGPRSREEVQSALNGYMREYQIYGHSFFATIRKSDQSFIGHCGLLKQEVEGQQEIELAYVLAKAYWKQGLALEGTLGLKEYGFQQLGFPRIISLIPPENRASTHIAVKIGMQYERNIDQWGQHFRLYAVHNPRIQAES
jgi:ribosomal-protein-alanine N-acetyltransferase